MKSKLKLSLYKTVSYPTISIQDWLDDAIDKYTNTSKKVDVLDYLYEHFYDSVHRTIYQGILINMDEFING